MSDPFLAPDTIGDVSLTDALAALDLELKLRDSVYPRLVAARKLPQREAERRYRASSGRGAWCCRRCSWSYRWGGNRRDDHLSPGVCRLHEGTAGVVS
jgi:hypothetical protein